MTGQARDAAKGFDRIIKSIHDNAPGYRLKREDESWFQWWQAYQHDMLGEEAAWPNP